MKEIKEPLRVVIKEPGKYPYMAKISNTLEALQQIVGGYIETVTFCSDMVVICNEEGRLRGLPFNFTFCGVDFYGPIIFAGIKGDEFTDVPFNLIPRELVS